VAWLERYLRGDHVQVWTEMTAVGARVRDDESIFADACAVVAETMRRARANVEVLVDELRARGYRYADDAGGAPPFEPPATDIAGRLDDLERRIGMIPLALRGWYEHVGRVNLAGSFPDETYRYTDPLVVDAPVEFVTSEFEEWEANRGTAWDTGRFTIDLAPDWLHKANVSGGGPYAVEIPNSGVDGLLLAEPHLTTFVNYLRIAFAWSGFPGWERGLRDGWARPSSSPPEIIADLRLRLVDV
jgi:hypothetical protein